MSSPEFEYDAFLSYASEDGEWCEKLAGRLRDEGVRVWFDKWETQPGDHVLARRTKGTEKSRKMIGPVTQKVADKRSQLLTNVATLMILFESLWVQAMHAS